MIGAEFRNECESANQVGKGTTSSRAVEQLRPPGLQPPGALQLGVPDVQRTHGTERPVKRIQ
jgi:hypothetical protein